MKDYPAPKPPYQLDPFALPQETRARFRMFIAAAVVFAWSLGAWWVEVPNLYAINWWAEPELQETSDRLKANPDLRLIDARALQLFQESRLYRQGVEFLQLQFGRILISLAILVGTLLLALTLYLLHPRVLRRRYRTSPLESPKVTEEVQHLASVAGVEPPRIAIKPGFLDGLAFGLKGREILTLGGQRMILARRWTPHTRAVALHELGHIVNGDIRTRVSSSSIWTALTTALVGVGALALVTSFLVSGQAQIPVFRPSFVPVPTASALLTSGALLARTLVLLLAVWWLWSELIRTREFYADARVATWGYRQPLLETLCLKEASKDNKRLGRLHPPHTARIEHLENPGKLFRTSRSLAFLTGLLLTLLAAQMTPLSTDLTTVLVGICAPLVFLLGPVGIVVLPTVFFGVLCLLAYLVSEALGTQVQRETIAELATRPHHHWGYSKLIKIAFFFALGLQAGLLLSPFSPFSIGKATLWVAAWILILTFLVWLWLVFLKGATRFFLGTSQTLSRRARGAITLLSTVILAALLGSALVFRLTIEAGYSLEQISSVAPPGQDPMEFFVVMFLMSSLFLLVGAFVLYLILGTLTGLAAAVRVFFRRKECLRCGEPAPTLLLVGRRCRSCRAPLAPWPFLGESP